MTKRNRTPVDARPTCALLLAFAVTASCLFASAAHAEPVAFDVPAQPMEQALRNLAERAGAQVLFTPGATAGLQSRPVRGRMDIADALATAVQGRGLDVQAIGPGAFVVRPRARTPQAQRAQARPAAPGDEEVLVTGLRPDAMTRRVDAPYAITIVGQSRLGARNSTALADVIALTPGFWVESSGGEASNNIRARGVPLDGYASIAVFEDGLPVQHDAGLGFLNPDQLLRPSLGLARMEIVRGGPAAVQASQAPGGLVNAVMRRPPDTVQAKLRAQTADFGGARFDGYLGGPVGDVRISLDGFWRRDRGLRDTGFDANRGGAARAALAGRWGGVDFDAAVKRLDDRVAFFLPAPLRLSDTGEIEAIPGFDAGRGTLLGPDLIGFDPTLSQDATGPGFRIEDGTHVRLTQATIKASWAIGAEWTVDVGVRGATSQTDRNGLFPRTPQSAAGRAAQTLAQAQANFPGVEQLAFRLAANDADWPISNDRLVIDAIASRVSAPLDEALGAVTLAGRSAAFGADHKFRLGLYGAHSDLAYQRRASTVLLEARENARRLDILALDARGATIGALTQNGVVRAGVQYDDAWARQHAWALFGAWDIVAGPRWTFDAGARWEVQHQTGAVARTALADLGGATLADDAVLRGTGEQIGFRAQFDTLNATIGARYALTPDASVFVRASRAARLPSISDFYSDPSGANARKAPTQGFDLGLSIERADFAVYAVAFHTAFDGFPFNETIIDPNTGDVRTRMSFATSQTSGLELEARAAPAPWLGLDASLTYQEPRFNAFTASAVVNGQAVLRDFSGRQLVRVPRLMARFSPTLKFAGAAHEVGVAVEHFGARFADAANSVRLPPYTVLSGHVRLRLTDQAHLLITGTNLTDEIGLTEGNPRTGQISSLDADQRLFSARPIFGRTFRATLTIDF